MDRRVSFLLFWVSATIASFSAMAVQPPLPGSADAGRIKPDEKLAAPDHSQDQQMQMPSYNPASAAPEGAKSIHFKLEAVKIEGMTAFTQEQIAPIYSAYVGKEVTLDIAWMIAGSITEHYHNAGYFLSRAYVPAQSIKKGEIVIKVIEGYIGKVELPEDISSYFVIRGYIENLMAQKPATTRVLESFLLRMDDLPGYTFRAVLSPLEEKAEDDAAVKLVLMPTEKGGKGSLTLDNYSSRYLGPNEASASYSTSLIPLQQTTVSGLSSVVPFNKLHYTMLNHMVMVAPGLSVEFSAGETKAYPAFSLQNYEIKSTSFSENVALNYQLIRQRQENLSFKLLFESRDVSSDILHTPLTRDHIRVLRGSTSFDIGDNWGGYNLATTTVSRGLDVMSSSQKGDRDLSRAGATPDFTKAELLLSRTQNIIENWSLYAAASGQWASRVLYSSEQFGYGGQAFGRAYDSSDFTGDSGVAGSVELRYGGFTDWQPIAIQPYTFYDIGSVWNSAVGQIKRQSAASAGMGLHLISAWHQSGNLGVAFPLTKDIATPIYGSAQRGPRILLQFNQEF